MRRLTAAIYARVSSDRQVESGTIQSQVAELEEKVRRDGNELDAEMRFIDEGYSGSTLVRPALERLRDQVAAGVVDKLYVLCPDRVAGKFMHQALLLEEFGRAGTEVVFVNRPVARTPEDELLLQVQGIVAEYERAKILERSRRGKRHAARNGAVSVLSAAPYGYRYVKAQQGGSPARFEVLASQARIVEQIFSWVAEQRLSTGEVCRRLNQMDEPSPKGKAYWERSSAHAILKNPTYKGSAAFGKRRIGPRRARLRPGRGGAEQPRQDSSRYRMPPEEWINIPVPSIISEATFEAVAEQLEENRLRSREQKEGASYLDNVRLA
jgi:site-specific DNA recombinase